MTSVLPCLVRVWLLLRYAFLFDKALFVCKKKSGETFELKEIIKLQNYQIRDETLGEDNKKVCLPLCSSSHARQYIWTHVYKANCVCVWTVVPFVPAAGLLREGWLWFILQNQRTEEEVAGAVWDGCVSYYTHTGTQWSNVEFSSKSTQSFCTSADKWCAFQSGHTYLF